MNEDIEETTEETTIEPQKAITADELREITPETTLEALISGAADKLVVVLTDFAKTARKAGSTYYAIPKNAIKMYIKDIEPRSEMLEVITDIYIKAFTGIKLIGYEYETKIDDDEKETSLVKISW